MRPAASGCAFNFAGGQLWSEVSFFAVEGQTYTIRVAGFGDEAGFYKLTLGD